MKNKYVKKIISFITSVLVSVILIMLINVFANGMYLIGIPDIENVEKVTISYPEISDEIKAVSDAEHIELAVKLSGFLKYCIWKKAAANETPMITMTYYTFDGDSITISANRETVWWKDKAYVIKDDDTFINLTEGIFYLDDLSNNCNVSGGK